MLSQTCLICPRNLINVWCRERSNTEKYNLQFQQEIVLNHTENTNTQRLFSCGALIWHEMGTGKTLTGLCYLKQKKNSTEQIQCAGRHNTFKKKIYRPRTLKKKNRGGNPLGSTIESNLPQLENELKSRNFIENSIQVETPEENLQPETPGNNLQAETATSGKNVIKDIIDIVYTYEGIIEWLRKLSVTDLPKTVELFDNKYAVFDEAHELVSIFRDKSIPSTIRQWFFHRIRNAQHFLLLTGTPMYNEIMDISFLVNLCGSQKEPLIPFSERDFFHEYYSISYTKCFLFGWINPLINNPLMQGALVALPAVGMSLVVKDAVGTFTNPYFRTRDFVTFKNENNGVPAFLTTGIGAQILKFLASLVGLSSFSLATATGIIAPWIFVLVLLGVVHILGKYKLDKIYYLDTKKLGSQIGTVMSYHSATPEPCSLIQRLSSANQQNTIHFKNTKKCIVNIKYNDVQAGLFLDYTLGTIGEQHKRYFQESDSQTDTEFDIFEVDYSKDTFLDEGRKIGNLILKNNISHGNTKSLNRGGSNATSGGFQGLSAFLQQHPRILDRSYYQRSRKKNNRLHKKTRVAKRGGTPFSSSHKSYYSSFYELLYDKEEGQVYPPKFLYLLGIILIDKKQNKEKGVKHAVYSEFNEHGIDELQKFFKFINEKVKDEQIQFDMPHLWPHVEWRYQYMKSLVASSLTNVPWKEYLLDKRHNHICMNAPLKVEVLHDTFGTEPDVYDVLLLHREYYAGVNLNNARAIHILEPILKPSKLDQVIARANRYNKQGYDKVTDLPVYMYICNVESFMEMLMLKMRKWRENKNDRARAFWKRFKLFDQNITPDYITFHKMKEMEKSIATLRKKLPEVCRLNHSKYVYDSGQKKMIMAKDDKSFGECSECNVTTPK